MSHTHETSPLLRSSTETDYAEATSRNAHSTEEQSEPPSAQEPSNDSTIVATLLAPISSSFSSLKTLSWIGSSYLIGNAAAQPLSGRLTDIFGRREGLILCNVAFGVGTLLCGLATQEWVMILGRAIAGLGGGAMQAISTFVGSDLVPLRKRGVVQGINNIAMGVGAGLGGLLGGWIDQVWGWKWAFLIQIPIIIFGTVMVSYAVKIPIKQTERSALKRVDYLGSLTLMCALVLLLLGLNSGGNIIPWNHPLVLVSLPLAAGFFVAFVYIEEKVALEPIIPLRLMLNRTVAAACGTYWFAYMASYGLMFYVPIYLQVVGNSAAQAGMRFIPQSAGTAIGALGAGIIIRMSGNYFYLNIATHTFLVVAAGLISTLTLATPSWCPFLYLGIAGLGFGGMLVTTLIALISAVKHEHQALVTSAAFAFRSTGSTIGLTISSTVFQNILNKKLWERLGGREDAGEVIGRIRENFDEVDRIDSDIRPAVQESYISALRGVFVLAFGISCLAAGISLLMRQNKLHTNLARR